jgi:hypothetical protein
MNNIIISDNFFPDLNLIKTEVMKEQDFKYFENQSYPGQRTECLSIINSEYYAWFCEKILGLLFDIKCNNKIEAKINTHFQKIERFSAEKNSPLNFGCIHQDESILSGIIYLNDHSGTNIYKLKKDCDEKQLKEKITNFEPDKKKFFSNESVDVDDYAKQLVEINSNFDLDILVANKANRLFIFPSNCWHGVPSFYGNEPRYTQVFFIKNVKMLTYPQTQKMVYVGKHKICLVSPQI